MELYRIHNRVENASNASMPLYTILVIFVYSSTLVDNRTRTRGPTHMWDEHGHRKRSKHCLMLLYYYYYN